MTAPFEALQNRLKDSLSGTGPPSRVLITTPAGSELMATLSSVAQSHVDSGGQVFVATTSRAQAEQWSTVLRSSGISSVKTLQSASDALIEFEAPEPDRASVMISTIQLLGSGVAQRATASLTPSLLIIELAGSRVPPHIDDALRDLLNRSSKVVLTANPGGTFEWFHADTIESISTAEALDLRPEGISLVVARYQADPSEIDLYERAREILSDQDRPIGRPFPNSRPTLHARLLRQVAHDSGESVEDDPSWSYEDDGFAEPGPSSASTNALWQLLDEIEGLGPDPKINATAQLVAQSLELRPVVIVGHSLEEVDYIAAGLEDLGLPVTPVSDSKSRHREWSGEDSVLVIARGRQSYYPSKEGTEEIWWSQPRSMMTAIRRLTDSASGSRVVVPIPEPASLEDKKWLELSEQLSALGLQVDAIQL